ncbi:MAG: type II CRISPR-associated endonuclease Cas1 [Kiritimatiellae bacterium]|nr:type II CRISPR-associated endonuclease Cas1 [Kiritimatiellia bacterium]
MIAKTLAFGSPGKLSLKDRQLVYDGEDGVHRTFPVEDLGFVFIETGRVLVTSACLQALSEANVAVVVCGPSHLPQAQLLPFEANATMQETAEAQLEATPAAQGRLWKRIVQAKLRNQAALLSALGQPGGGRLENLASAVKNGDPANCEAQGARIYFQSLAPTADFRRNPDGVWPNAALDYGYAVLRAAVARALVGSGLVCFRGIHHHNRYNPFCLADDVMEAYRPFVDQFVFGPDAPARSSPDGKLTPPIKAALLSCLTCDVAIGGLKRPLMIALSSTSASLARCYLEKTPDISLPAFLP